MKCECYVFVNYSSKSIVNDFHLGQIWHLFFPVHVRVKTKPYVWNVFLL
jgi:hypothetical protein